MPYDLAAYVVVALAIVGLAFAAIRVLREYERGVVFTLGRFTGVKGPGLIILVPVVQQMVRIELRTLVHDVPSQDVISRDNVSVKVNAVLYFRVVDPERAVLAVEEFYAATSQLAQTTLRSVLGKHDLDEMLAERDKLNADIQEILDKQTDAWGIKGRERRDQACRHRRIDDPRDRPPGRSGTGAEGESDQRRRRATSGRQATRGSADPRPGTRSDAVAVSLDAQRPRQRAQQLDDRLSISDEPGRLAGCPEGTLFGGQGSVKYRAERPASSLTAPEVPHQHVPGSARPASATTAAL